MNIIRHFPNAITCGNLFCGCLAIVSAFKGNLVLSAYLVGIAAVLDFFDGFVARLLKVGGELGKQLDSLADMVTFGVVPGVIMFKLIEKGLSLPDSAVLAASTPLLPYAAFFITIFSGLRLAKFNIDTRQTDSFIGVPTPANSILICSLPLILEFHQEGYDKSHLFLLNPYLLIGLTIIMSYLLVAELPLFALKFKKFNWAPNRTRYTFLIISVTLLILFQFIAIPFIIFLYISLSILSNIRARTRYRRKRKAYLKHHRK
jgi:CDP-diacylglycerol--serine O-phosphatidyltransferase